MKHFFVFSFAFGGICLTLWPLPFVLLCCFFTDGNVLQFEDGYLVETVVEGNDIGVVPYKIRVSEDGELFAVDSVNSNIVRITPPLSQCNGSLTLFLFYLSSDGSYS